MSWKTTSIARAMTAAVYSMTFSEPDNPGFLFESIDRSQGIKGLKRRMGLEPDKLRLMRLRCVLWQLGVFHIFKVELTKEKRSKKENYT